MMYVYIYIYSHAYTSIYKMYVCMYVYVYTITINCKTLRQIRAICPQVGNIFSEYLSTFKPKTLESALPCVRKS